MVESVLSYINYLRLLIVRKTQDYNLKNKL